MSMRKMLATGLTVALMLTSCGSNIYTSKQFAFSAICPDGWTVSEDMISVCFGTPAETDADDFFENVTYAGADEISGTIDEYMQQLSAAINENSVNYTEISCENATFAGYDARVLTYTCTSSQTSYIIKQRMFVLTDGKQIFNLVYTANTDSFDVYAAQAEAIAESFKAK